MVARANGTSRNAARHRAWCRDHKCVQAWLEPPLREAVDRLVAQRDISVAELIEILLFRSVARAGLLRGGKDVYLVGRRGRRAERKSA